MKGKGSRQQGVMCGEVSLLLGKKDVGPGIRVERARLGSSAVGSNALVEGFVKITCRHGPGVVVRREGVGCFGGFKDESGEWGTVLQLVEELNLQRNPWPIS
jgi:hypothetical protein